MTATTYFKDLQNHLFGVCTPDTASKLAYVTLSSSILDKVIAFTFVIDDVSHFILVPYT